MGRSYFPLNVYEDMRLENIEDQLDDMMALLNEFALKSDDTRKKIFDMNDKIDLLTSARKGTSNFDKHLPQSWKVKLAFEEPLVNGEIVYKGNVDLCTNAILTDKELEREGEVLYVGATSNPQNRIRSHLKNGKVSKHNSKMHVVFATSDMHKAMEMEHNLINRLQPPRNVFHTSSGLVFGKASYFVYMLKSTNFLKQYMKTVK